MFDYVVFEHKCPVCQGLLNDWQSKDGPRTLSKIHPSTINKFYGYCMGCNAFVDIIRIGNSDKFQVLWKDMLRPDNIIEGPEIEIVDDNSLLFCDQVINYVLNVNPKTTALEINEMFLQPFLSRRGNG